MLQITCHPCRFYSQLLLRTTELWYLCLVKSQLLLTIHDSVPFAISLETMLGNDGGMSSVLPRNDELLSVQNVHNALQWIPYSSIDKPTSRWDMKFNPCIKVYVLNVKNATHVENGIMVRVRKFKKMHQRVHENMLTVKCTSTSNNSVKNVFFCIFTGLG